MVKTADCFYATLMWEGEDLLFEKDKEKLHIAMLGHKQIPSRDCSGVVSYLHGSYCRQGAEFASLIRKHVF